MKLINNFFVYSLLTIYDTLGPCDEKSYDDQVKAWNLWKYKSMKYEYLSIIIMYNSIFFSFEKDVFFWKI
jgi:hypothetical protein